MSVLDRAALEQSPLADLHAIASELGLDGYRRLRKADLIDAIMVKQGDGGGGSADAGSADAGSAEAEPAEARPAEAGPAEAGPADAGPADADSADADSAEAEPAKTAPAEAGPDEDDDERAGGRRRRGRRGGRGRSTARAADDADSDSDGERAPESDRKRRSEREPEPKDERDRERDREREPKRERVAEEEVVEGEVDLLPNGSAFVRVNPPEPSDDDVYISAAQVKRCELVSGDRIAGPRRAPRRSERFASLIRIDTINGRPASEVAEGARFDDLPAAFPNDRFRLGSDDPTLKAIEWLTPFGKGSRVTITGAARSGKTEALRRLTAALTEHADLQLFVVAAGVRPEEISEWNATSTAPTASTSFGSSPDAQAHTIELVVDRARRAAARGGDAVVLIDTLDGLAPHAARKSIASARKIVDGGSVTVIATARDEIGGETTVIALDAKLAAAGRFPALDIVASGTIRPELLVGEAGAEAIARARAVAEEE